MFQRPIIKWENCEKENNINSYIFDLSIQKKLSHLIVSMFLCDYSTVMGGCLWRSISANAFINTKMWMWKISVLLWKNKTQPKANGILERHSLDQVFCAFARGHPIKQSLNDLSKLFHKPSNPASQI